MKQEVVRINKAKASTKTGPGSKQVNLAEWSMDAVEYYAEALSESKMKSFDTKQENTVDGAIFIVDLFIEGAKYKDGLCEGQREDSDLPDACHRDVRQANKRR